MTDTKTKGQIQREEIVKEITSAIAEASSVVFANYQGLSANAVNELRTKLNESGARAKVLKNTLVKLALKENKYDDVKLHDELVGPTMAVFSEEDPIAGVKALYDFAQDNEILEIKAGIIEGIYNNENQLKILSTLPSKEELIAQVIGGLKSPVNGIVNTLGGVQRKFVYALSAIADEKAKE